MDDLVSKKTKLWYGSFERGGITTAQPLDRQTYVPTPDEKVGDVLSFIEAHETSRGSRPEPRYFLAGANEGDHVELPATVYRVLLQVIQAMAVGKAVTVAPQNQMLTTQQVADLLNVSRPTVVKFIDEGELRAETPGARRRMVRLDDVLEFQARRRDAQYEALLAMTVDDYDLDDDPGDVADELRRIRARVVRHRRGRTST